MCKCADVQMCRFAHLKEVGLQILITQLTLIF